MPELVVLYDHDPEDDVRRTERAQSYCAFWEDRFGNIHFTAYPEDRWEALLDRLDHDPARFMDEHGRERDVDLSDD